MTAPIKGRATLFRQFAVILLIGLLGFTVASSGIVTLLYSRDEPQLARDLLRRQSEALVDAGPAVGRIAPPSGAVWRWRIVDDLSGQPRSGGDAGLALPGADDRAERLRYAPDGEGLDVSGVTAVRRGDRLYWVALALKSENRSLFAGALALELVEHVALPLAPLVAILLGLGLWQVGKITRPLRIAAAEADALDPARPESRLTRPDGPAEAGVLVAAFNRALARIESSGRLIRQFNAHAAHEMRTPLAVMSLSVDRLSPGELKERLTADIEGLKRVVGQMLDLAQADALETAPFAPFDLADVASEVIALLAPLAWDQGRDIVLERRGEARVIGHREAVARAVRNLVENALRHSPPGGIVEVAVGPGGRLTVRDHGKGVPDADKGAVFERFWRGDRSAAVGAGLGLGIVQATMEAHGGRVGVEDADGGGARFVLEFDVSQAG